LPHAEQFMVMGLAIGMFFAIPIFTVVFFRLLFGPPMPTALEPSLMILVAPFAVGMSTYLAVSHRMDLFAQSLFVLTVFMLIVLLARLRHLRSCCPFRVSWWSVSFPLTACAIAALRVSLSSPGWASDLLAAIILVFASAVILWLFVRTLVGIFHGELRTLSA